MAESDQGPARVLGVIYLKDVVKGGMRERFDRLRAMGIRTVMITGDNPLTAAAIAQEAGVDDFLAEAKPEDKMALIKREQAGGKLVAMTGDGTNDAPALAQADVGVAMNSGTQAAKEAGNMIDLDSNPTKLIEVVEIGKQLLMTRGSFTTFSIANDVAKYFAIIPAMFVATYPALQTLNIMRLHSSQSAILASVIFNALIIIALIPLALRGVRYRPASAAVILRRNSSSMASGVRRAVHRHQDHRHASRRSPFGLRLTHATQATSPGDRDDARVLRHHGGRVSRDRHRPRAGGLPAPGERLTRRVEGHIVGSALIGQSFTQPYYFHSRPSAAGNGYDATASSGTNKGPTDAKLADTLIAQAVDSAFKNDGAVKGRIPTDMVTSSASGLDPHISPANAYLQVARVARARHADSAAVRVSWTRTSNAGSSASSASRVSMSSSSTSRSTARSENERFLMMCGVGSSLAVMASAAGAHRRLPLPTPRSR